MKKMINWMMILVMVLILTACSEKTDMKETVDSKAEQIEEQDKILEESKETKEPKEPEKAQEVEEQKQPEETEEMEEPIEPEEPEKEEEPGEILQPSMENPAGWYSEYYDSEIMYGTVLRMYGVTDAIIPVLNQFTEDTGIVVEPLLMEGDEILQQLLSGRETKKDTADIWYGGDANLFIRAAQENLLYAYQSLEGMSLNDEMKDSDGYWYGISLSLVNWTVNTDLIEEKGLKIPETWDELLQEGLKGEISMSDPSLSESVYNTTRGILQVRGEEEGWSYLEQLMKQVTVFTTSDDETKDNVVAGEAVIGITSADYDHDVIENNEHIKQIYPREGTAWWLQSAAIIDSSNQLNAAKVFMDWLLSRKGMETVQKVTHDPVVREDIEIQEGIDMPENVDLLPIQLQSNDPNKEQILETWKKHMNK